MTDRVISTSWISRASLYWIPVLIVLLIVRDYPSGGMVVVRNGALGIALFILLAEQFLYGFKYFLRDNILTVKQGWLIQTRYSIDQDMIQTANLQPLAPNISVKSARVEVSLKNGERRLVNLSSLSCRDSDMLMRWLGVSQ